MKENVKLNEFYNRLDRKIFLDDDFKSYSGYDKPLPIGYGQTISQPTLVYNMINHLNIEKGSKVLEIGTGSGYQTAFLAEFAKEVYTIEFIEELSSKAKGRLDQMGYKNIFFKIGDGSDGWPENSPYDRIIVSAAASMIPDTLLRQLSYNGLMIIPVGNKGMQELMLVKKETDGHIIEKFIDYVTFVEFKGRFGWTEF